MNPSPRRRGSFLKRLSLLVVLLTLWGVAASDRHPVSLTATAQAAELPTGKDGKPAHDLKALRVFNRAVLLIKDNYVDPKRIEPRKMLVAALDGVERQVAEVLVEGDEKSPKLKVTVNKASKEFDVSEVNTFWRMTFAAKEIFAFIDEHLTNRDETRDVEYAAANGMLSTLDPHSVLLKPEYFKEMKLQTKGEFGGLGFVIQMKESILTVVRVLKGTPAQKAGIKSKDQILRIGNESTVNMDLNDAVSRLRGKPGSEVQIVVQRPGAPAKPMALTRAIINVESVEAKLLEHNVGYIKLKGFQGNTARDLHAELRRLKGEAQAKGAPKLKGLVLDLRGNPGGLLEQAIQVSDAFLSEGTIVTTAAQIDKLREVKKARADESDIDLPLVVIVNNGSASASEIVAGALKNLDRALVVGRQTFGKGSVQVLYDFPDESALKLTIAQYLTPGDKSIQEVGITPDIELVPSRVAKDRVDVFAPKKQMGEADLDKHFGNPESETVATKREEVVRREQPLEELRFLRDETPAEKRLAKQEKEGAAKAGEKEKAPSKNADRDDMEAEDLEGVDPDTDEIFEDYQIRFARDLLLAAPFNRRDKMLAPARAFVAERRTAEQEKISKSLASLGIDWSLPPQAAAQPAQASAPRLSVEMKPAAVERSRAGDTLTWTVTATNSGTAPFHRLRAYSQSDNAWLDRREFIFGALAPGQRRSWPVQVKLPKDMLSRRDEVTLKFFADGVAKLEDLKGEISIVELPRPAFAYSWQIVDRCDKCNGDGLAQPGETVEMAVEVNNVGRGPAHEAVAMLKNKTDENISLSKGRFKLGELAQGQSKGGVFEFEVKPEFKADKAVLQLTIGDDPVDEYVTEKLDIPVVLKGETASKPGTTGVRAAAAELPIRSAAQDSAPVIATAKKGALFPAEAKIAGFYRIRFGANRIGFVAAKDVREARADAKPAGAQAHDLRTEPKITLSLDTQASGIVTDSERFSLSGEAHDLVSLRDLYIFVNEQKVFFKSATEGDGRTIKFNADMPLKAGSNTILVVARQGPDLMARRVVMVRRRGQELAQQTPPAGAAPTDSLIKSTP